MFACKHVCGKVVVVKIELDEREKLDERMMEVALASEAAGEALDDVAQTRGVSGYVLPTTPFNDVTNCRISHAKHSGKLANGMGN